ncbi:PACE efflux transporter [Acidovorax sp. Leaf160]|uniref:PACE efflux transporter n=1 Tax=Acidovorax sp. Leaf160 TaxID=1736280 RepID=UPI000A4F27F1|nr:PACE efflux transporter [Acidovorax sp. Leaf160]
MAVPSASSSPVSPPAAPGLQGVRRRVVYVALYEAIAIAVATLGLSVFTGQSAGHAGVVSVMASAIAIVWNVAFNWAFERWESRQASRHRTVGRRVVHAIGFEGGLACVLVPVLAWWFGVSLWQALLMDLGLLVFFLVYTFVFNWGFDRVFGLPASALAAPEGATPAAA